MAYNEIQDMLIEAMVNVVDAKLNEATFDQSVYVVVLEVDQANNKYTVVHNGTTYTNLPCESGTLNVGDTVRMVISNNKRTLIGKATEYDRGISVNRNNIETNIDDTTIKFDSSGAMYSIENYVIATEDETISFTVADKVKATEAIGLVEYQWELSITNGKKWQNSTATGAKTDTVSVKAISKRNGYLYRCKISYTTTKGEESFTDTITTNPQMLRILKKIT